ncbi:MAG: hypothetical protein ACK559_06725, partial [bacterium]
MGRRRDTSTAAASGVSSAPSTRRSVPSVRSPESGTGGSTVVVEMDTVHGTPNVAESAAVHACASSRGAGRMAAVPPRTTKADSASHCMADIAWGWLTTTRSAPADARASNAAGSIITTSTAGGSDGASARATHSPCERRSIPEDWSNVRRSTTTARSRSVDGSTVAEASSAGCASTDSR